MEFQTVPTEPFSIQETQWRDTRREEQSGLIRAQRLERRGLWSRARMCGIRDSHGVNPGKDPNTMDGCYMWCETNTSQPTHYCKLVQEKQPYGSLASANKGRWKSRGWKESQLPEPSSNVAIRCPSPGCKEVSWKRYLYKHISQKHANLTMTPTVVLRIAMYPHERGYISQCTRMKEGVYVKSLYLCLETLYVKSLYLCLCQESPFLSFHSRYLCQL